MNAFKCKMCGGTVECEPGASAGVCDSCGTQQTVPKSASENALNLFTRADNLRKKGEFDKAEQLYERILEEDDSQAEAHWGVVLCRYGIEYVEDPESHIMVPTCHRASFEAVTSDPDYSAAIDYSDTLQQTIYEKEAREIDRIQRDILKIVREEKPFDVFICYKETDEYGSRTVDSAITNDIYYQLAQEGFKVFYAPITLEDKLGAEYEPYIFAALNSAKVMLAVGTKPEYFNAVWVKNEWSRFLKLMKNDRSKVLIPCFKDMSAYDLPEEFAHFQAQDMGKIGFINDVVRGLKKILTPPAEASAGVNRSAPVQNENVNLRQDVFDPLKQEFGNTVRNLGSTINSSINNALNNVQTKQSSEKSAEAYPSTSGMDLGNSEKLGGRNKLIALILCLLFGTWGVHNFYLGDIKKGIIRLAFFWCGIGTILAIIDFIKLLTDSYTVQSYKP